MVIRPVSYPRQNWDEAFKMMAEAGDDKLLDNEESFECAVTRNNL